MAKSKGGLPYFGLFSWNGSRLRLPAAVHRGARDPTAVLEPRAFRTEAFHFAAREGARGHALRRG